MSTPPAVLVGYGILCLAMVIENIEETREMPRERDNARNTARCTQARKTTHGLDGRHQDVDRTRIPVEESIRMTEHRDK